MVTKTVQFCYSWRGT